MIDLINVYFKTHLETNIVPVGATVGYGDLDLIYRKTIDCKQKKNLPIFGIRIQNVKQWNDEANTPLITTGQPDFDDAPLLPDTMQSAKMMNAIITYDCFYLTNNNDALLELTKIILFANYDGVKSTMKIPDPIFADPDAYYQYQVLFGDNLDFDKRGNEYEMGYQYFVRFPVELKGVIADIDVAHIIKHLDVKIMLDEMLMEEWTA